MKFRKLGNTNLDVSLICLGTMTWGTQNSEKDAFEQMDYSVDQGINFFDTAEIYSVPPDSVSYGKTEKMRALRARFFLFSYRNKISIVQKNICSH